MTHIRLLPHALKKTSLDKYIGDPLGNTRNSALKSRTEGDDGRVRSFFGAVRVGGDPHADDVDVVAQPLHGRPQLVGKRGQAALGGLPGGDNPGRLSSDPVPRLRDLGLIFFFPNQAQTRPRPLNTSQLLYHTS